jgi:hypothetical protein
MGAMGRWKDRARHLKAELYAVSLAYKDPETDSPTVSASEQKTGVSPKNAVVPDRVYPIRHGGGEGHGSLIPGARARAIRGDPICHRPRVALAGPRAAAGSALPGARRRAGEAPRGLAGHARGPRGASGGKCGQGPHQGRRGAWARQRAADPPPLPRPDHGAARAAPGPIPLLRPLQRPARQVPIENLICYRADLLPTLERQHAEPETDVFGEVEFPPLDRRRAGGRRRLLLPRLRRLGGTPHGVVNLLNAALPRWLGRNLNEMLTYFERTASLKAKTMRAAIESKRAEAPFRVDLCQIISISKHASDATCQVEL